MDIFKHLNLFIRILFCKITNRNQEKTPCVIHSEIPKENLDKSLEDFLKKYWKLVVIGVARIFF